MANEKENVNNIVNFMKIKGYLALTKRRHFILITLAGLAFMAECWGHYSATTFLAGLLIFLVWDFRNTWMAPKLLDICDDMIKSDADLAKLKSYLD